MTQQSHIRIGIGGWTFAPWRGVFYPETLRQADELSYAASNLTAIEINAIVLIGSAVLMLVFRTEMRRWEAVQTTSEPASAVVTELV